MSDNNIAIETQNLTKYYKDVLALSGLNLKIKRGTLFGFIGPNGAGKTTAIRVLCGLQKATSGTAIVAGEDVTKHPARVKSMVGYMPEEFGTYERMRVVEYLDFFAAAHRIPIRKRKDLIDRAMDLGGVAHMRDYYMGTLSRGMKQRVGLTKTLVHDPEVLILDEPTSGLDPFARIEIRQFLRKLKETNKTVMISSHILPELASVCDEVGIINQGQLLAHGPVREVMAQAQQGRRVEIELLGSAEGAADLLKGVKHISGLETVENMVRFVYSGPLEKIPSLHHMIMQNGYKILWMREVESDLEHAFITITGGTRTGTRRYGTNAG